MGYDARQVECDFEIRVENHPSALETLKAVASERGSLCWVNSTDLEEAETLTEALRKCGWDAKLDAAYNIVSIQFEWEKIGDEDVLFNAVAPFVKEGSFIHMVGGDGDHWRWVFRNGGCVEETGKIVWEATDE